MKANFANLACVAGNFGGAGEKFREAAPTKLEPASLIQLHTSNTFYCKSPDIMYFL